jgi:hypothetical protein
MVEAFGETKTLAEWSRDARCRVSYFTLAIRVSRGWDGEVAISTPSARSNNRAKRPLEAFGETKLIEEWVKDRRCKVSAATILWRVQRNYSGEDAVTKPMSNAEALAKPKPPKPEPVLIEGFGERKTIKEWAEDPRCTISRPTLEKNLIAGQPLERAITFRRGVAPTGPRTRKRR